MITAETRVKPSFARDVRRMIGEGRLEAAFALSADGVRAYPTYIGGYVMLAECFAALGHLEDAVVVEEEILRRRPDWKTRGREDEKTRGREDERTRRREDERRTVVTVRHESPLRIIELAQPTDDTRVIRSSSVRLIPGLEYTSLRFEGAKHRGRRSIQMLSDPPAFREFHALRKSPFPQEKTQQQRKLSLEELADRIGKVRITAGDLEQRPPAPDPLAAPRQSVVSETLAKIYMQQKSYDKAIEAFRALQDQQPDNKERFQKLIDECETLRAGSAAS